MLSCKYGRVHDLDCCGCFEAFDDTPFKLKFDPDPFLSFASLLPRLVDPEEGGKFIVLPKLLRERVTSEVMRRTSASSDMRQV